jgi:hypothetical protein
MTEVKKRVKNQYVNNKDFLAALITYRDAVREASEKDEPRPQVPNYVGECVMKIATHLARKPNFVNYTFKDEMISDGIENCLQYIDNFNPDKSNNPFAYFTQIIWFAFLRRIQKEKKVLYTKYKLTEQVNLMNLVSDTQEHDSGSNFNDNIKMSEWSEEYMNNFIRDFEENKRKKIKKRETKS